jgi:hypothetical protein
MQYQKLLTSQEAVGEPEVGSWMAFVGRWYTDLKKHRENKRNGVTE